MSGESKIKVLLAEDDINLGYLLVDFLGSNGFVVNLFRDGEAAFKGFMSAGADICIIDIMLPRMDGFTLAGKIKKADPDVPLIILSARSMKEDKIKGFTTGVDDYVTKPFDEEELVCRINAILTRSRNGNPKLRPGGPVTIGSYTFDESNQLLSVGGVSQRLTIKESRILGMLYSSSGNIVKKDEIMSLIWGDTGYYTGRSLDVFISKLRGYLKNDPGIKITTIPTVGYILSDKIDS
jgi:DNA-binding response OmpR family regulator